MSRSTKICEYLLSKNTYFDTALKITDIIMFNSRNLGALIVKEKPHVKSWDEPQYSIQNLAIEESYGFGVLNEGQAIAVAKNIHSRTNGMSTPEVLDHLVRASQPGPGALHRSGRRYSLFGVNSDRYDLASPGFVS